MFKKEPFESRKRSVLKVVVFTAQAVFTSAFAVWYFSGKVLESIFAGIIVEITDIIALYLLERLWSRITWGYNLPKNMRIEKELEIGEMHKESIQLSSNEIKCPKCGNVIRIIRRKGKNYV